MESVVPNTELKRTDALPRVVETAQSPVTPATGPSLALQLRVENAQPQGNEESPQLETTRGASESPTGAKVQTSSVPSSSDSLPSKCSGKLLWDSLPFSSLGSQSTLLEKSRERKMQSERRKRKAEMVMKKVGFVEETKSTTNHEPFTEALQVQPLSKNVELPVPTPQVEHCHLLHLNEPPQVRKESSESDAVPEKLEVRCNCASIAACDSQRCSCNNSKRPCTSNCGCAGYCRNVQPPLDERHSIELLVAMQQSAHAFEQLLAEGNQTKKDSSFPNPRKQPLNDHLGADCRGLPDQQTENHIRRRGEHRRPKPTAEVVLEGDISEVPPDLVRGICTFLFDEETCPIKELEKYVVRYARLRTKRGDRRWSPQENEYLRTVRLNLLSLTEIDLKKYKHAGLRISYMQALEGAWSVVEILVETHEERKAIVRPDAL